MLHLDDLPLEIVYKIVTYLDAKSLNNVCAVSLRVLINFQKCRIMIIESLMKKMNDLIKNFLIDLSQKTRMFVKTKSCWLNITVQLKSDNIKNQETFQIDGLTGYIRKPEDVIFGPFNLKVQLVKILFYSHIFEYKELGPIYSKRNEVKKRLNVDETLSKLWKKISHIDRRMILARLRKTPISIKSENFGNISQMKNRKRKLNQNDPQSHGYY
jgi:hypothetical protein